MSVLNWLGRSPDRERLRPPRIVVIDLETSGLDTRRDCIISFGGVAVVNGEVQVADSFEAIVQQDIVSPDANIAIHGVMGDAQRCGTPLAQAYAQFEAWRDRAPIVGWHVKFDYMFLSRTARTLEREPPDADTLDVAELAAALSPQHAADLDAHAAGLGLLVENRHHAVADAWATAMLYAQYVTLAATRENIHGYAALRSFVKSARWLNG